MTVTIEGIGVALGLIVTGSIVAGIAVRLILLPYVKATLVDPMHEEIRDIRDQVKNSHDVNLRDDLDDKHSELLEAFRAFQAAHVDHLTWSQAEVSRLWAAIRDKK